MPFPRAASHLIGLAAVLTVALVGAGSARAVDFFDHGLDPRYRAMPRPQLPADPSVPKPASLTTYSLHERSGVVHIVDGTWEELPYTYEVLVDGRVLQEQGPGNMDFRADEVRVPFHTSIWVSDLEPGTRHELGVRRLTPDWRRSATTTISVVTPGERVPESERPATPELQQVRSRGAQVTLQFKPGEIVTPYERSIVGVDLKLAGRELSRGMSGDGEIPVTGLEPGTTYRGEARSRNIRGDTSAWVPIAFATASQPAGSLQAPTPWVSLLSTHGADISWEPLRDATGALAQPWYRLDGGPPYPAIQTDAEAGRLPYWTAADGKALQPGTAHRVELWWVDLDGRRTPTRTVTFTTKLLGSQPPAPGPQPPTPGPRPTPLPPTPAPWSATPGPQETSPVPALNSPILDESGAIVLADGETQEPGAAATPRTGPPEATLPASARSTATPTPTPGRLAGPTTAELRAMSLAVAAAGPVLSGRAELSRPAAGGGISVKVAVRAGDCRWWRFGQARFAGSGRKAGLGACTSPPSWRAVETAWTDRTATFKLSLGKRPTAGRYVVRVRFQRGRAVLTERAIALRVP